MQVTHFINRVNETHVNTDDVQLKNTSASRHRFIFSLSLVLLQFFWVGVISNYVPALQAKPP